MCTNMKYDFECEKWTDADFVNRWKQKIGPFWQNPKPSPLMEPFEALQMIAVFKRRFDTNEIRLSEIYFEPSIENSSALFKCHGEQDIGFGTYSGLKCKQE